MLERVRFMTKEEIAGWLEGYGGQFAAHVVCAIRALDVCTLGEREWLEASLSSESLRKSVNVHPGSALAQARDKAIAERTPPDPVETFIAEVRSYVDSLPRTAITSGVLGRKLLQLDAARRGK
jgi:hypothetical protein